VTAGATHREQADGSVCIVRVQDRAKYRKRECPAWKVCDSAEESEGGGVKCACVGLTELLLALSLFLSDAIDGGESAVTDGGVKASGTDRG